MVNCAVVGCTANDIKCRGLSFHSVHRPKNPDWEKSLIKIINRCDKSFNATRAKICSRHFEPDCFREQGMQAEHSFTRVLIPNSLPTLNLPTKSCERPKPPPRKPPVKRQLVSDEPAQSQWDLSSDCETYPRPSLSDICRAASSLPGWHCMQTTSALDIIKYKDVKVERMLRVYADLNTEMWIEGVPCETAPSLTEGVEAALEKVLETAPCSGILDPDLQDFSDISGSTHFREISYNFKERTSSSRIRSTECHGISQCLASCLCSKCRNVKYALRRRKIRHTMSEKKELTNKTPLRRVARGRLTNALKDIRHKNKKLKEELRRCQAKLAKESITVSEGMSRSLSQMISSEDISDPFVQLFWAEQKKNLTRKATSRRWHPMIIRLAILIHSQSPKAYNTLRDTGVLVLPGESTLRDFTNAVNPRQGFNPELSGKQVANSEVTLKGLESKGQHPPKKERDTEGS